MAQLFRNNIFGVLQSGISNSATSMTLTDASGFPAPTGGDHYLVTLVGFGGNGSENAWEIIKVTAKAANTLTVVRAQEGTTAVLWPGSTQVQMRLTAGSLSTKADINSPTFTGTVSGITKAMVGLESVDNTSDAAKPVSTAQQTALNLKVDKVAGKGLSTEDYSTAEKSKLAAVAAGATANATNAELRDRATHTGTQAISTVTGLQTALDGKETAGSAAASVAAHVAASDPHSQYTTAAEAAAAAPVQSVAGRTGAVTLAKADVGLGSVDNTSDASKPISTATQTALDAKQATLVSGTNIKTINGQALPGSGNIEILGGPAVNDTAPSSPANGQEWVDGTTGIKYTWVEDGTSGQWVELGPGLATPVIADVAGLQAALDANVAAAGGVASGLTLNDGYTEEVFAVTGTTPALSPTNGSIQTWALSGNSTPTAGTWASGQSMTLMVDDGSAYTINWASMSITWKTGGGAAPTLNTTGFTAIALWKVWATIYGARVGDT